MKLYWTIIIFVVIILIAIITNPSTEEHKQAVKHEVNQLVQNSVSESKSDIESLGVLLGSSLAEKLVENSITRDNYILFSITKISWKGESRNIGYGLFGNVFLSEKVKEAFGNKSDSIYDASYDESLINEVDTSALEAVDTGAVD
jgi:hypothetical protein